MKARQVLWIRLSVYLLAALTLGACSVPRLEDAADMNPVFDPREFFDGKVRAWGIVQDWRGRLERSFVVDIVGRREGDGIILDEAFLYADGEQDQRTWHIEPVAPGEFSGRADDIIGVAEGRARGNALRWRYEMDLEVGKRSYRVHFDDWMWQLDDSVLANRSYIRKFGLTVAEVTLFMQRRD
ncbi:MAG: DUF3833 domain-containing protein [Gammaproteobacteria bacterium]